jgi:acyl carrier protein
MSTPDESEIARTIRGIACEVLKLKPEQLNDTTSLRELPGVESIKVLRIIAKIEREYRVELEDGVVFRVENVAELASAVRQLLDTGGKPA